MKFITGKRIPSISISQHEISITIHWCPKSDTPRLLLGIDFLRKKVKSSDYVRHHKTWPEYDFNNWEKGQPFLHLGPNILESGHNKSLKRSSNYVKLRIWSLRRPISVSGSRFQSHKLTNTTFPPKTPSPTQWRPQRRAQVLRLTFSNQPHTQNTESSPIVERHGISGQWIIYATAMIYSE